MSLPDFATSIDTARTRFHAQPSHAYSPPQTPSPSSPIDLQLTTSHSSSTLMSDPTALTPEATPSEYGYHIRDAIIQNGHADGIESQFSTETSDHIDKGGHSIHGRAPGMEPARSNDTARLNHTHGKDYGSLNPGRARSPSPLPNSFASSSFVGHPQPGSEQRERVISPPHSGFLDVSSSPAPAPVEPPSYASAGFDPSVYQPDFKFAQHTRSRSPYPGWSPQEGHHSFHPLSMPNKEAVNVPTEAYGGKQKEKFTDSAGYWLGLYFFFNLGLTLFNKLVLSSFPFPYTLTGLHALSGCAGCYFALERGAFTPARLNQKENIILLAFSVLYTINIAVSNISLQLVTVPFHQVVRASTPLFTILISTVLLRTKFSARKLVSLLPVVAGVGFATYGDYNFTAWGLILTLLGTFLAALKTVVTNLIQTGGGGRLKLHPLDLLMRMSPLAFIQCVAYGWYTGELERVRRYGATQMTRGKAIALLVNGVIACGLNIVSFTANKKAGALTMTVSANCKQVLTIALAVVLFDLHINFTNGIGILLTLIGGGWYGYVEYSEKKKKAVKASERG